MIIPINEITPEDSPFIGGKAANLSKLISLGYNVPKGFCISTNIYSKFLDVTGLNHKINEELNRGNMDTMRWEELWDTSLRIRNFFNTTFLPEEIQDLFLEKLKGWTYPVVVRSSSPGEDSSSFSFAGLHESYIDIKEESDVLEKIKLVWSSLWSDSALLYRKELDLNIYKSSMGVIIQEMIFGEVSGVAFSKNPLNGEEKIIIEAVEGLNQKLVSGETEPCRWIINKKSNEVESVTESVESSSSLLDKKNIEYLSFILKKLEKEFNFPIDLEWTLRDGNFFLLQVRPITTFHISDSDEKPWEVGDKRPWYRSLTLSFTALEKMKIYIEEDIFPQMKKVAIQFENTKLESMNEKELNIEIKRRQEIYTKWKDIYWEDLIPFAHGVRLFAQVYNDTIKPKDPYEFTGLLSSEDLISVKRNKELGELISEISNNKKIKEALFNNQIDDIDKNFKIKIKDFLKKYETSTFKGEKIFTNNHEFISFLLNSSKGFNERIFSSPKRLEEEFLSKFTALDGKKILEIARASWKFRDDDNLYLGRIEAGILEALDLKKEKFHLNKESENDFTDFSSQKNYKNPQITIRRFTGQPASPGIGSGKARIISSPKEIFHFKKGEVLICDSLDPNMTFIVPLASAIIESRGGMLIHGAIIAREYGIPCVTGVGKASESIKSGDYIIVDGYLGTVSISDV
jgi:phosphoenolpyruvate synthase/pyruvate phosphate dikinase